MACSRTGGASAPHSSGLSNQKFGWKWYLLVLEIVFVNSRNSTNLINSSFGTVEELSEFLSEESFIPDEAFKGGAGWFELIDIIPEIESYQIILPTTCLHLNFIESLILILNQSFFYLIYREVKIQREVKISGSGKREN
jgi:hypothetical protein